MERPISSVRNGSSSRLLLPSTGKLSPPVPGAYSPSCVFRPLHPPVPLPHPRDHLLILSFSSLRPSTRFVWPPRHIVFVSLIATLVGIILLVSSHVAKLGGGTDRSPSRS